MMRAGDLLVLSLQGQVSPALRAPSGLLMGSQGRNTNHNIE